MKQNFYFTNKKNKNHLKNCFCESIKYNDEAIDFVENKINYFEDVLSYNEGDESAKYQLEQYKYIHIVLSKTDDMYRQGLKECGG